MYEIYSHQIGKLHCCSKNNTKNEKQSNYTKHSSQSMYNRHIRADVQKTVNCAGAPASWDSASPLTPHCSVNRSVFYVSKGAADVWLFMNLPSLAVRLTAATTRWSGHQRPELHRIPLWFAVIPAFPALMLLVTRPDVQLHYSFALLPCDKQTDWLKPARHYIPSVTDEHPAHIQKKMIPFYKQSLNLEEPVDFKIAQLTYNVNHVLLSDSPTRCFRKDT